MTQVGSGTATVAPETGFVEWSAVFAGAAAAAALSFVFLTFGSAIGLTIASPWPNSGVSGKTAASLAVFWTLAQQIGAFMIGGYIAGRMRSRWVGARTDDVEFRDGLHGALVWAVGIAIGAVLLFATAGIVARAATDVAAKAATVAATSNTDITAYYADMLLRPAPRTPGAAATAQQAQQRTEPIPAETKAEVARILTRAFANGGALADADKAYLSSLVAQRTGLPVAEADKRVGDTFAEANRATREAADKARRAGILVGFVTAASLLISLAAAWWAAQRGGSHRDQGVPARFNIAMPMPRVPRQTP